MLNTAKKEAWVKLLRDQVIARSWAAVTSIRPSKIVIFGGLDGDNADNNGYIFDLSCNQVKPILGRSADVGVTFHSQTQWIGSKRHLTLGVDKDDYVHLVQLQFEKDQYQELRSLRSLGHREDEVAEEQKNQARQDQQILRMQQENQAR